MLRFRRQGPKPSICSVRDAVSTGNRSAVQSLRRVISEVPLPQRRDATAERLGWSAGRRVALTS